jgi:hypothetical protein
MFDFFGVIKCPFWYTCCLGKAILLYKFNILLKTSLQIFQKQLSLSKIINNNCLRNFIVVLLLSP